jgi:uncharacterized membrane protein YtjA (UPF0391 family)
MSVRHFAFLAHPIGALAAVAWAFTLAGAAAIANLLGMDAAAATAVYMAKVLFGVSAIAFLIVVLIERRAASA